MSGEAQNPRAAVGWPSWTSSKSPASWNAPLPTADFEGRISASRGRLRVRLRRYGLAPTTVGRPSEGKDVLCALVGAILGPRLLRWQFAVYDTTLPPGDLLPR